MRAGDSAIRHDAPNSPESQLIGGRLQEHPDRVARANPRTSIGAEQSLPPFQIMHGDADPLAPFNQSVPLVTTPRAAGGEITVHPIQEFGRAGPLFETPLVRPAAEEFFDRRPL